MCVLLALALMQSPSPSVQLKQPIVKNSASTNAASAPSKYSQSNLPPAQSQNTGVPSAPQPTPDQGDKNQPAPDRVYKVDVVSPAAKPLDTPLFPIYLLITGVGVFVNLWVGFLIFKQSRLLRHQVSIGHISTRAAVKSAQAAKESAEAAQASVTALNTQLDELRKSTDAASKSANASRDSADALVASERAWIQIEIEMEQRLTHTKWPPTLSCFSIWPQIKNYGRTPAKITKLFATAVQIEKPKGYPPGRPADLPPEPDYSVTPWSSEIDRDAILPPQMGITPIPINVSIPEFEATKKWQSSLYVYGYIDYFDVVGKPHQTRFCYLYWIPHDIHDPVSEGFMTSVLTPAVYTQSD